MPRGLMDDLKGEIIYEEVHEGGLETRLPTGTWVRIPHPPPKAPIFRGFFSQKMCFSVVKYLVEK